MATQNISEALLSLAIGTHSPIDPEKGISELEKKTLEAIFGKILDEFYPLLGKAISDPSFEVTSFGKLEKDPSIPLQSSFVYFEIVISIKGEKGVILVGYRGAQIKSILKVINESNPKNPLQLQKLPPSLFYQITVPIKATIGSTVLSFKEIKGLEPGDVLSFEENIENAISINLFGEKNISGQIGENRGKIVLRVVGIEKEKGVKVEPPAYMVEEENIEDEEAPVEEGEAEEILDEDESDFSPKIETQDNSKNDFSLDDEDDMTGQDLADNELSDESLDQIEDESTELTDENQVEDDLSFEESNSDTEEGDDNFDDLEDNIDEESESKDDPFNLNFDK